MLSAQKDDVLPSLDVSLPFLPSPETIKENVLNGDFGARGEIFVVAQVVTLIFIAFGTVLFLPALVLGCLFIVLGLYVVYKSAADLNDNLSPWPVPVDPNGKGSLIKEGIYGQVRHPMYGGLLLGMGGLSLATESF